MSPNQNGQAKRPVPPMLRAFNQDPQFAEARRERSRRAALARSRPQASVAQKIRQLAQADQDAEAIALEKLSISGVLVRPDMSTPATRQAFRESIVRGTMLGVIDRRDALVLLQAARDQSADAESTAPPEAPTVIIERFHQNGEVLGG